MPPEPHPPRNFGLDLLRAAAIALVLVSHVWQTIPWWFGAAAVAAIPANVGTIGTYGVVVFFALSGYLVGGIALRTMRAVPTPRSAAIFLVRRWLRTVPLYYAAIAVFLVANPPGTAWLAHAARYATFTQNLARDMPADRWFATSWSLTVEEWFYLALGTAGLALARLLRTGPAAWTCVAVLAGGPTLLRWVLPQTMWFAYADVLWFDCIAYGLALARIDSRRRIPLPLALPLAAAGAWCGWIVLDGRLALPAVPFVTFMPSTMATSAVLLIPLALHWRTAPARPPAAWLGAAVRWTSTRSYGLYLFHPAVLHPINGLVLAHALGPGQGAPPWLAAAALALAALASCLLAELGHRLVERPLMRRRPREPAAPPAASAATRSAPLPAASPAPAP